MADSKPTTRLQQLIHRTDRVLAVMHAPTAAHARLMELAGAEAAFVGTSGVVGTYTGLADVGVATMTECLTIASWIAQSVRFPVIVDGDTGMAALWPCAGWLRKPSARAWPASALTTSPLRGSGVRRTPA